LDDLEAEISYLLVRHFRPETLVEISPCGGWSSAWLLHALRDNGSGSLFSFDLVDLAPKNVPEELARGRWTFVQGDIRAHVDRLPPSIDYVFMDSDHSSAFCRWYIETIFRRLAPGTPVSVHDVFGGAACDPDGGEPEVILEWLRAVGVPFLTVSRADPSARAEVESVKRALGLEGVVHSADEQRDNPMIFFEIPGGRLDDPR
jgi:predicted O-methyltransferase YrrM